MEQQQWSSSCAPELPSTTRPGEWHWHGADPDHFMTHIALWEAPADGGAETEWGEHLTGEEYLPSS